MTVTLQEAQATLPDLMRRVAQGEQIVIVREDGESFHLVPEPAPTREPRPLGTAKGDFVYPDDFNDPLPDDLLNEFYK